MSKTAPTPSGAGSGAAELARHFDGAFLPFPHVVLAVSGGSDSTALMHMAAAWLRARGPDKSAVQSPTISVVTIDHALRAASAAEAAEVALAAGRLGLDHTTLFWRGTKPETSLQAAARIARRDLIRAHLNERGWPAVAMAHTADDQAETVLMRLARGSGVDGLAAMQPTSDLGDGLTLVRPLLGTTKADLRAWLEAHGIPWIEDPSNQSPRFERVRLRQARAALAREGMDLESAALARTAKRMARAKTALEHATRLTWASRGALSHIDSLGFATLDWAWLVQQPEDIRLRLLAGLLEAVGGQGRISLGQLERHTIERGWQPLNETLHGVQVAETRAGLRFARELGRIAPQPVPLAADTPAIWDGRFRLAGSHSLGGQLEIAALGPEGLDTLRLAGLPMPQVNSAILHSLPAIKKNGLLVAVPAFAFGPAGVTATFIGPAFAQDIGRNTADTEI